MAARRCKSASRARAASSERFFCQRRAAGGHPALPAAMRPWRRSGALGPSFNCVGTQAPIRCQSEYLGSPFTLPLLPPLPPGVRSPSSCRSNADSFVQQCNVGSKMHELERAAGQESNKQQQEPWGGKARLRAATAAPPSHRPWLPAGSAPPSFCPGQTAAQSARCPPWQPAETSCRCQAVIAHQPCKAQDKHSSAAADAGHSARLPCSTQSGSSTHLDCRQLLLPLPLRLLPLPLLRRQVHHGLRRGGS